MDMTPSEVSSTNDVHQRFETWLNSEEPAETEGTEQAAESDEVETVEQAEEVSAEADSQEQTEEAAETEDSELETLDIGGEKYELPKDVAEKVTTIKKLMEADYTRKTQEAADIKRQAIEFYQQTQQAQQFQQTHIGKIAEYMNALSQLEAFEQVDWQAPAQQDYETYNQYRARYDAAKDQVSRIERELSALDSQAKQAAAESVQKQRQACIATVQAAIPTYDAETDKKAVAAAQQLASKFKLPIDSSYLSSINDPMVWLGLTELAKYYDLLAKRPEVTKKVEAAKVKMTKPTAAPPKQTNREQKIRKLLASGRIREAAEL